MTIEITQFGEYTNGKLVAVPFQHHTVKFLWEVKVVKGLKAESIPTVAHNAEEAASMALKNYDKVIKERKLAQRMLARMTEIQGEEGEASLALASN